MRQISKLFLLAVTALVASAFFGGCHGYSQSDAVAYCDAEKSGKSACFTEASYNACVACFEECGDDCAILESCPEQYHCP